MKAHVLAISYLFEQKLMILTQQVKYINLSTFIGLIKTQI